jgi:hypothetical protein
MPINGRLGQLANGELYKEEVGRHMGGRQIAARP